MDELKQAQADLEAAEQLAIAKNAEADAAKELADNAAKEADAANALVPAKAAKVVDLMKAYYQL